MARKTVVKARLTPTKHHSVRRQTPQPRSTPDLVTNLQRSIGNEALQRLIASSRLQPELNVMDLAPGLRVSIGNQALQRLIKSSPIQPELNVARPGDAFVQDAEPVEEEAIPTTIPSQNAPTAPGTCLCESDHGVCECASAAVRDGLVQDPPTGQPAQDHTYTFISRGSYGDTTPNFTRPSCVAGAGGTATLAAGSASPTIRVFASGTYQVRRDDGVVQTATCTRLAAGLAATTAHENSHAAGARAGVASANTAQALPRNFPTVAACAAALPGILTAWNTTVNAAWANEVSHGPGTNPPTAQTFTVEHAAGTCTFA